LSGFLNPLQRSGTTHAIRYLDTRPDVAPGGTEVLTRLERVEIWSRMKRAMWVPSTREMGGIKCEEEEIRDSVRRPEERRREETSV
jgi:hypothetical protein